MNLPRGIRILLVALALYFMLGLVPSLWKYNEIAQVYGYDWLLKPHLFEWQYFFTGLTGRLLVIAGSVGFLAIRWRAGFWLILAGLALSLARGVYYVGWMFLYATPLWLEQEMPGIQELLVHMALWGTAGLYLLKHRVLAQPQGSQNLTNPRST